MRKTGRTSPDRAARLRLGGAMVLVVAGLAACGDSFVNTRGNIGFANTPIESFTAEQIFGRGEYELARNKAGEAAGFFQEVERLYPYSDWAKRAVIMQAFAFHKDRDYENSRAAAQRYIDFYPADEDAAYAQYLLALSYYDQIEDVGRDQGLTFQALQALRTVIERYPDSEYARSSILKFDLAFDHLASKEMEIGRFYLKRERYTAAINRFRVVVEDFQTTTHTAEALHRLVEAYLSLGLTDEAQTAGAILGFNYQSSDWYEDSFALLTGQGLELKVRGNSWLSAVYRQMVRGEWL
ncbi:outer membrane protein assembly factor BamD [Primorskyibacter sp. S187A]|uniref:outer membrane protein assembly factor BamD n=1 Tax=Primorskyibacter sp. S187A TaxID=3415130 RepID=UPI003C7CC3C1